VTTIDNKILNFLDCILNGISIGKMSSIFTGVKIIFGNISPACATSDHLFEVLGLDTEQRVQTSADAKI